MLELETDMVVLLEALLEGDDPDDGVEFADELLAEFEMYELETEELETDEVEVEELETEALEIAAVWAASDFWIALKTLASIQVVSNEP